MTTLPMVRTAACLALVLMGGIARADVASNTPANGKTNAPAAKPTVKLGPAMVQEREVLSNGAVRTRTTLLPASAQPAKVSHTRKSGK